LPEDLPLELAIDPRPLDRIELAGRPLQQRIGLGVRIAEEIARAFRLEQRSQKRIRIGEIGDPGQQKGLHRPVV